MHGSPFRRKHRNYAARYRSLCPYHLGRNEATLTAQAYRTPVSAREIRQITKNRIALKVRAGSLEIRCPEVADRLPIRHVAALLLEENRRRATDLCEDDPNRSPEINSPVQPGCTIDKAARLTLNFP